jgi:RNA polymerase sigma factor (TIGR02999 family)
MTDVTSLLNSVRSGDAAATDQLLILVYDELRRIAAQRLARETAAQTFQPTALVHEAYLRLVGTQSPMWENRAHFFAAAAEAMRRVLIDAARRKQRLKRAGGERLELTEQDRVSVPIADELLDLNESLAKLELTHPDKATVVKLKFFAAMTAEEIAAVLGVSTATVDRHWAFARAWLHRELQE